jgi:hypothetical protein
VVRVYWGPIWDELVLASRRLAGAKRLLQDEKHTPNWCLLAVYHFVDASTETETLAILEGMHKEAFSS